MLPLTWPWAEMTPVSTSASVANASLEAVYMSSPLSISRVVRHLEHHGVVVTPVAVTQQWQAACQMYWFWSDVQLLDGRDVCVGTPSGACGLADQLQSTV